MKRSKQIDNEYFEFQRFFNFHATQGFIDLSKFLRLIKSCIGLLDNNFTLQVVDLQFSKIKARNEKKINYGRFLELVANLGAIKFLNTDPTFIGTYTGTLDINSANYAYANVTLKTRTFSAANKRPTSTSSVMDNSTYRTSVPVLSSVSPFSSSSSPSHSYNDDNNGNNNNNVSMNNESNESYSNKNSRNDAHCEYYNDNKDNKDNRNSSKNSNDSHDNQDIHDSTYNNTKNTTNTPKTVSDPHIRIKGANKIIAEQAISSFRYAMLNGKSALLVKFILDFFHGLVEYKKIVKDIDNKEEKSEKENKNSLSHSGKKEKKFSYSAFRQALSVVEKNTEIIQRFYIYYRYVRKKRDKIARLKKENIEYEMLCACILIQKKYRQYVGRLIAMKRSQEVFRKYIDLETNTEFWYNPRTRKSFWKKPKLLQNTDSGYPILMPSKDEEFIESCTICDTRQAKLFCHLCNISTCRKCYQNIHKSKNLIIFFFLLHISIFMTGYLLILNTF